MMKVYVKYDESTRQDILDVPDNIVERIDEYQQMFLNWLFDKNNDHQYWRKINNKKVYCEYNASVFVKWINTMVLCENNEKITIRENVDIPYSTTFKTIIF